MMVKRVAGVRGADSDRRGQVSVKRVAGADCMFLDAADDMLVAGADIDRLVQVSKSTLKIMMDEFCRGRDIIQKIDQGKEQWSKLFEPLDSFKQYANFLQIQAFSPTHSRLPRNLLEYRSGQGAVVPSS